MSKETIVSRIIADAEAEAAEIVATAKTRAETISASARMQAEKDRLATEKEVEEKARDIREKKAAAARLDGAKILLAAKRSVIDGVYARALERMVDMSKEEAVKLSSSLLSAYADEGDTVYFAENFKYVDDVAILPIVKAKKLIISTTRVRLDGGFMLVGRKSDKKRRITHNNILTNFFFNYKSKIKNIFILRP